MVTAMLVFLQCSAATEERRSSSSRSRSSSSSYRGSNRGRGIGSTSGSNAGQPRLQDQDLPYYMMCPEVRCPPVSSSCQTIEYLVYEYQHDVRGKGLVTVRCQSCEYCLDPPPSITRGIRSYGNRQPVRETSPCFMVQCPMLPETCIDVRLTSVLVDGQQCDQCPACYDQTVFNSL